MAKLVVMKLPSNTKSDTVDYTGNITHCPKFKVITPVEDFWQIGEILLLHNFFV